MIEACMLRTFSAEENSYGNINITSNIDLDDPTQIITAIEFLHYLEDELRKKMDDNNYEKILFGHCAPYYNPTKK